MVAEGERPYFNTSIFQQKQPLLSFLQGHANAVYALSVCVLYIYIVCFQLRTSLSCACTANGFQVCILKGPSKVNSEQHTDLHLWSVLFPDSDSVHNYPSTELLLWLEVTQTGLLGWHKGSQHVSWLLLLLPPATITKTVTWASTWPFSLALGGNQRHVHPCMCAYTHCCACELIKVPHEGLGLSSDKA